MFGPVIVWLVGAEWCVPWISAQSCKLEIVAVRKSSRGESIYAQAIDLAVWYVIDAFAPCLDNFSYV